MSTDEEQRRILDDASKVVREKAFYMKRAIDGNNLKQALDNATEMLKELRSNVLWPKNYYDLYMKILDEMRELEEFFASLQRTGHKMVELYEQVQSCGNVVPRLYLMCCVGGVYITSQEAPAKDILKDMLEMVKGVQHPTRGLFLRCYLTQISRNKLPDIGTPYEGQGGTVQDAVSFLLTNFIETNRLWVRLQTQGANKDKKRREKERQDLRVLVGTTLVRLSQLDGLDVSEYRANVLPKVLEEIVACKDTIAQGYLMDCVIQVFPDEFHLSTLEIFLNTCNQLKEKVPVRNVLEAMMDRLSSHASNTTNGGQVLATLTEINAFKLFNDCITTLIMERTNMTLAETLRLQTALTNFALKCYPGRLDYVSHCLGTCSALIEKTGISSDASNATDSKSANETTGQIEALLSAPLSSLSLRVMQLPAYAKLMTYLPWGNWKEVAATLVKSTIATNTTLSEVEHVEQLFSMITPLLKDNPDASPLDAPEDDTSSPEAPEKQREFKEQQALVAKVVHLMKSEDTDVQLRIYVAAKTHFTGGGLKRMQFTLPPLVFGALSLARRVFAREKAAEEAIAGGKAEEDISKPQFDTRKVFFLINEIVTATGTALADLSIRLFINAAQAADDFGFSAISYEFLKEALLIYENEVTSSEKQVQVLKIFIGALLACTNLPTEDYETLITRVAQHSSKLLEKADQSRMITLAAHLFWPKGSDGSVEHYADNDRLVQCMQKALKLATVANPNLFVEILDHYIYYYENDNPIIQDRYLSGLIVLINEHLDHSNQAVVAHYRNTREYIRNRQQAPETSEKFLRIELG